MAHIVPNPPGKQRDRALNSFTVFSKYGDADVIAWGIPHAATDNEFKIAADDTGTGGVSHVASTIAAKAGPYVDLRKFHVTGLRPSDKIAIYRNTNFGTAFDENWVTHSPFVTVVDVRFDHSAKELADGKLPSCAHNGNIKFYPFGSGQLKPPMKEKDWLKSVTDALDTICATALGKAIVQMIRSQLVIYPWFGSEPQATSEVLFTPKNWDAFQGPGGYADEVLLHELIHVIEDEFSGYADGAGFVFDGSDFVTVNATNVYSCLLGRGLRKDHSAFAYLPQEYFDTPKKHFDTFRANYLLAKGQTPVLYQILKTGSNLWNPFVFEFTP